MQRILIALFFLVASPLVRAELQVFACEPEWASLAAELGGGLVEVKSATHALQDPHYIQARPSLISRVRRADLLICSGADLEIGWLPKLLDKANNRAVRPGSPGYLEASAYVTRLDVPESVDRAQGDMHPQGNPHVQLNPYNLLLVADELAGRLSALDAANAGQYAANLAAFRTRWTAAIKRWEALAEPLTGLRVITHHKSWVYLEDWLGLKEMANLEPVPGVPPTASHLSDLLARFGGSGEGADLIIRAPYQSDKASLWLADRAAIPAVILPLTVGGSDEATGLYRWFDDIIQRLLDATREGRA